MIHDLDESLRELIRTRALNGSPVEISLEAPSKEWAARRQGPALNLYLYDVQEDMGLRTSHFHEVRNEEGRVQQRRKPPRWFRLSYLVTAWTQRPEDEHRLLSAVLSAFLRSDVLPPELRRGSLVDLIDTVRITIAVPPAADRSVSDIWTALGGELKPSLDIVVIFPFAPDQQFVVGPIVTEEPRFTFVRPDRTVESPDLPRRSGFGRAEERQSDLEETVRGGRTEKGRVFRVRGLRRR